MKPGTVAMVTLVRKSDDSDRQQHGVCFYDAFNAEWVSARGGRVYPGNFWGVEARPLVVIDPEDRGQVAQFVDELTGRRPMPVIERLSILNRITASTDAMQEALREFADPKPTEPTDPKAQVEDRRENVWRLLADGDWVCTSGPDVGEYLAWGQLAERGPLTVMDLR